VLPDTGPDVTFVFDNRFSRLIRGNGISTTISDEADTQSTGRDAGDMSAGARFQDRGMVCSEDLVPEGVKCSKGWKCIRVVGQFDFSEVGILSQLALPLAGANVPIFVMSTFDTDYVMVRQQDLQRTSEALCMAGHHIQ
jgi:hypothetical protein